MLLTFIIFFPRQEQPVEKAGILQSSLRPDNNLLYSLAWAGGINFQIAYPGSSFNPIGFKHGHCLG
jgi:hypothetical protein